MSANTRNVDILCFGGEDWWYHNRAHIDIQLMRRFAKKGTVIYINSIVMQKPTLRQGAQLFKKVLRKTKSIFRGLRKTDAGFFAYSPLSLPAHHIRWAKPLNEILVRLQIMSNTGKLGMEKPIVWVACPAVCDTAIKIKKSKLVYQRTDLYEKYPNVDEKAIVNYDRKLKQNADLTIFVNQGLYEQERRQCRKAICLDHGVDFETFSSAEKTQAKPGDLRGIKPPIIGFFGGIDQHTCDISLMEQVAKLLPQMSFVFVGKVSCNCSGLKTQKNVWMLGQKPYEQIPQYGKCFDVAIMPWQQNIWIEACNPIKLKEFLALGKPVVSTPFPELEKYQELVYQAKTPEEFASCIKRAISEDCTELVSKRRKEVEQASWDSKAELVMSELLGKH